MDRRAFIKTFSCLLLAQGLPPTGIVSVFGAPVSTMKNAQGAVQSNQQKPNVIHNTLLPKDDWPVLMSTLNRFSRIQAIVGFGNFCILGFDDSLRVARDLSLIHI